MHLSNIHIRGFRNFEDLSIDLKSGLNVIVGENNTGKTNMFDAIRLILSGGSGPRDIWAKDEDLHHDRNGEATVDKFRISLRFSGVEKEERGFLRDCLAPDIGHDVAVITFQCEYLEDSQGGRRKRVKIWGGSAEGGTIESEVMDALRATFLPALRDAEGDLRPGRPVRRTRISRLLDELSQSQKDMRDVLEKEVKEANDRIRKVGLIEDSVKYINQNLVAITGPELAQKADIALADPEFRRITNSMRALIGSDHPREMTENGLGYNNLLYVSTILSELQRAKELDNRLLLVEEPEAHLHPQLQVLLVDHLLKQSQKGTAESEESEEGTEPDESTMARNPVQVIVTTHSPTLASRVPLENVTLLYKRSVGDKVLAHAIGESGLSTRESDDLSRYLDITKATLLFSKGVILVEGISEALLLPVLATKLHRKRSGELVPVRLEDHLVSVVNIQGLAFRPFAKLFREGNLQIPCALLTDSDRDNEEASETAQKLKDMESGSLEVHLSKKTFEFDLAVQPGNTEIMAASFRGIHPQLGKELKGQIASTTNDEERASIFLDYIRRSRNKARFAQRLAADISDSSVKFKVPPAIRKAISHATRSECE